MIKVKKEQLGRVSDFFEGIEDSMVIACLQGYMGDAYVKSWEDPKAALIVSGEYSFFGGDAQSEDAEYLADHLFDVTAGSESTGIFSQERPEWEKTLMSCGKNHPQPVARFAIAQRDYEFDQELLRSYMEALPAGFELRAFDENLYAQAMEEDWSKEFCETFGSAEDFLNRGFGFGAVKDGKLAAGASTMTVYDGGAEIQVATKEEYRKKGLALACAAAVVLESCRRNMRPCWDAANLISKKMAIRLGYEYKGEYTTVFMCK